MFVEVIGGKVLEGGFFGSSLILNRSTDFEKFDSSNRLKVNGCSFQQVLRQNLTFCLNIGKHFF